MKAPKIFLFAFIFSFLFFLISDVFGLEAGSLGIRPAYPDPKNKLTQSWFIYNLEPGESKEDAAIVTNFGGEEVTIKIYVVDSKLSNDDSFTLEMENEEKNDVGAWVKFLKEELIEETKEVGKVEIEKMEVTLDAGEAKEIPFIITISENADVGEHSGGIVIQAIPKERAEGQMVVVTRMGARIYQTVPGEIIKKLVLTNFTVQSKKEKYIINFSLKNEGNVSLTPEVKLSINDLFFHKIDQALQSKFQVSRGAEIRRSFEWEKPKLYKFTYPGKFLLQAEINYDGEQIKSDPIIIWIIPWLEISILGGIILILLIIFGIRKLLAKKERKRMKEYKVKAGETIESIASQFGMNWRKLAKINKLKPPFILKTRQKIYIIEKLKVKIPVVRTRQKSKVKNKK